MRNSSIAFFVILCFTSCTTRLEKNDFMKFIETEEAFNKTVNTSLYHAGCSYRPPEYLALNELMSLPLITKDQFSRELNKFSQGACFFFSIGFNNKENIVLNGVKGQAGYAERIGFLNYSLNDNFFLLANQNDTIRPLTYTYMNNYGVGNEARFMVMFPKDKINDAGNVQFVYEDKELGISEKVMFDYSEDDFKKTIPHIKDIKN